MVSFLLIIVHVALKRLTLFHTFIFYKKFHLRTLAQSVLFTLAIVFTANNSYGQKSELPAVFLIGEHEQAYEGLSLECNSLLLSVCNDTMELAYKKWMSMLSDIETYAAQMDFDINGVKIWTNVYWNPDGSIKHIAYYPKPNSKNMNFKDLTQFLEAFVAQYKLPVSHTQCFSHYGSANFPTFAKLFLKENR